MASILMILVLFCASIAARNHHPQHGLHHAEYKNATTTENAPMRNVSGSVIEDSRRFLNANGTERVQRLTAVNSRSYSNRRHDLRHSGFERRSGRNSTTVLKRRNSVYMDIPAFGQDTWRRDTPETTTSANLDNPLRTGRGRSYHKNHDGRHVCIQHKTIQVPIKTTEVYTRPTWRHVNEPCHMNQICTRLKVFQEPAYRDIIRHQTTKQIVYDCCPGWEQTSKSATACTKPICKIKCKHGGTCIRPDICKCTKGFTGKYCEIDINECKEQKPCDQLCYNTEGSYYCRCREGFILHTDAQSCKKIDGDTNGIEARDLENEVDNEALIYRLHKVEKMIAIDKVASNELHRTVQETSNVIDSLQMRVNTLERKHQEINSIQDKLRSYEAQSRKLEHLVGILLKCRSNPHPMCP